MQLPMDDFGASLFNSSPNLMLITDEASKICFANPAALSTLGFSENEITGRDLKSVLHIDASSEVIENFTFFCPKFDRNSNISATICANDGREFSSEITVSEPHVAKNGKQYVTIFVKDNGDFDALQEEYNAYKDLISDALAAIPEGFAIYDKDDHLRIFNEAYRQIYAESAPAIKIGSTFEKILRYGLENGQYITADDSEEAYGQWLDERLKNRGNPIENIVQKLGNGRYIRIEERKLASGHLVGFRSDITPLIEAKSLAESLGGVLDNIAAPVLFVDINTGLFEYANKAALEKLQYSAEEIITLRPRDLKPPEQAESAAENFQAIVSNPSEVREYAATHTCKDGSTYECLVRSVCDSATNPTRIVSFVHDISAENKMRHELAIRRVELETLVKNLPGFITHAKPDSTIFFSNDLYADFIGLPIEEMIGRKFYDFVPEEARESARKIIDSLTPENPMITSEQRMKSPSGEEVIYLWTNCMVFEGEKAVELVSVGRDVTHFKQAQAKIEKQAHELAMRNDALEQFTGIVSHDLRAPLRHIRMFGEMLLEDQQAKKPDNFGFYIDKMQSSAVRMERLIANLLEFSQVAYKEVNRSQFTLRSAFDEVRDNLASVISESKAVLELDNDVLLELDHVLFIQLLHNLIDNAIKYRDGKKMPVVRVGGKKTGDMTTIFVQDNGIGIPEEQKDRIFNVFQRLHADEKTYKGTGIGLSLVKRITEGHNGEITLDTDYDDGCRFILSFPAA